MFGSGSIRIRDHVYKLSERPQPTVWMQRAVKIRSAITKKLGVIDEQREEEEAANQELTVSEQPESKDCWTDEETAPVAKNEHMFIRDAQQTDESVSLVYKALEQSSVPPDEVRIYNWPPVARILWHNWRRLNIRNGILHYRWEAEDGTGTS